MRDRRRIADGANLDARCLEGTNCRIAAGPGALNADLQGAHADFASAVSSSHCRLLGGERRTFARSFKAERARTGPTHHVALQVGNRHNSVVERSLNVRLPARYDPLF